MAKKVTGFIKLQIAGGKANPSPPIGPALGQKGVNIMEFCKAFNAKTQKDAGMFFQLSLQFIQTDLLHLLLKHLQLHILKLKKSLSLRKWC